MQQNPTLNHFRRSLNDGFRRDREQSFRLLVEGVQVFPNGAQRFVGRHNEAPEILLLVPDFGYLPLDVDFTGADSHHLRGSRRLKSRLSSLRLTVRLRGRG
jgi:hypothetical protein